MLTIDSEKSLLLIVDFQEKLMPVINAADEVLENASRLMDAAEKLHIPVMFTEQNSDGLGPTVSKLADKGLGEVVHKMSFDACRASNFFETLKGKTEIVIAGCEAHVCVLQTALGLLEASCRVFVVEDAIGSRLPASKEAGVNRLRCHGAEIVTTEMAIFEWLKSAENPQFRDVLKIVK